MLRMLVLLVLRTWMMVEWVLSVMLLQLRVLTLWQRLIPRELLHHHPQEWKGWHRHQEQKAVLWLTLWLD